MKMRPLRRFLYLYLLFILFVIGCKPSNQITGSVNRGVDSTKTNTYIIDYDFQAGIYRSNNLKLKVNTPAAFKISNVNRMAYDVNVSSKDSILAQTYFFESPAGFFSFASQIINASMMKAGTVLSENTQKGKDITTITSDDVSKKITANVEKGKGEDTVNKILKDIVRLDSSEVLTRQISLLKGEINNLAKDSAMAATQISDYDSISNKKQSLQIQLGALNATTGYFSKEDSIKVAGQKAKINNDIKMLGDELSGKNIDSIKNKKNTLALVLKGKIDDLKEKEKSYQELSKIMNAAFSKFKDDNYNFIIAFGKLKDSYNKAEKAVHYFKQVMSVAQNPELTLNIYQAKYKNKFDIIYRELDDLMKDVIEFGKLYADLGVLFSYLKYNPSLENVLSYGGQVKLYAHADHLKDCADKMNDQVKELDFEMLLNKMEQAICFLSSENAYTITFSPVQPFNDVVVFDVNINKKEKNSSDFYNNRNFSHREYTYGGTRIDFGLGLAASYFGNSPVYELSVKDSSDLSRVTIAQKANHLVVPSLVGLMTMSYRKTGYVTYGASAGLGIDVINGKIQLSNFFGGPSMIFGKYDRLTLTAGGSIRNVGQLKSGYEVGQTVKGAADDISSFITDKYKLGGFLSLTYNFTKGVKDNISKWK